VSARLASAGAWPNYGFGARNCREEAAPGMPFCSESSKRGGRGVFTPSCPKRPSNRSCEPVSLAAALSVIKAMAATYDSCFRRTAKEKPAETGNLRVQDNGCEPSGTRRNLVGSGLWPRVPRPFTGRQQCRESPHAAHCIACGEIRLKLLVAHDGSTNTAYHPTPTPARIFQTKRSSTESHDQLLSLSVDERHCALTVLEDSA